MRTRVKICGITRLEDAECAVELGAEALGFNFFPPSPRYIDPAAARSVIKRLPPFVTPVGVFANEGDAESIAATARQAGVRAVQLHGRPLPSSLAPLAGLAIIRAISVGATLDLAELARYKVDAILLDGYDPHLPGGTGRQFAWELVHLAKPFGRIILAGGLTPDNVAQAVRAVRPFAVDVASGVESAPGIKDLAKLRAFFEAVEDADRALRQERPATPAEC
jgi:phosphoribosylanthranilate isomerase